MIIKPANRTNSVSEYYFSKKLQEIDLMNRQGAEVINLGIGAPDRDATRGSYPDFDQRGSASR